MCKQAGSAAAAGSHFSCALVLAFLFLVLCEEQHRRLQEVAEELTTRIALAFAPVTGTSLLLLPACTCVDLGSLPVMETSPCCCLQEREEMDGQENENVEMDAPPRDGNVTLTLHSHIRDGNATLSCCASHRRD